MEKEEKRIPSLEETGCEVTPEYVKEECDSFDCLPENADFQEVLSDSPAENEAANNATDLSDYDESKIIRADGNFDCDQWISEEDAATPAPNKIIKSVFEFLEMLALVTVAIVLCFSFVFRLNIVEGPSMENTLHTGEYLIVSDLFYEPVPGDIIVIHDLTMEETYTNPIVKRVIATEGQTVDIDFTTWTLTVDGKPVDESSYRKLEGGLKTSNVNFPLTVEPGTVFVLGDNRNHSADSRLSEIGLIDERCIIGKVYARIFPFDSFTLFKNPYND